MWVPVPNQNCLSVSVLLADRTFERRASDGFCLSVRVVGSWGRATATCHLRAITSQAMIGYGGGGGGGGGVGRGGAHYGPAQNGKGGRRGKGGGGSRGGKRSGKYLSVSIPLDAAARPRVIGPGGSIVKQMQRETGAHVNLPKRDAAAGALSVISGATPHSVLHVCSMIAHRTFDVAPSDGYACECKIGGDIKITMAARLHRALGSPWLFTADASLTDGAAATAAAATPFAAVALQVAPPHPPPDADALRVFLDDLAFSLGTSQLSIDAAVLDEPAQQQQPDRPSTFFVFAIGAESVHALNAALPALCERFSATAPSAPAEPHEATAERGTRTVDAGGDDDEEAGGTELASLDLIFIRHAECFHTAAVGMPSAIMAQFTSPDPAIKASVESLVTRFTDPIRVAQGEWKKCASDAPFALLTKADTPLLPSELASGVHESRLRKTIATLNASAQPFLCASPPLLRMMSTAAIAASYAPADGPASESLRTCLTSSTMLPRPSPLHTPDDIAALTAAAKAALEAANKGEVTDGARTVLGAVAGAETAAKLLTAFVPVLEAYGAMHSTGGFAADGAADAAAAGSGGGATAFAKWAFSAAASRRVSTVVVYGGSGWWAGLIKELRASSEGLSAGALDVLLPELALDPTAVDADGSPIKLPLLAPPAGARYVRIVRRADGFGLALPTEPAAAALNPKGLEEGADRETWLKGLLAAGECCSY